MGGMMKSHDLQMMGYAVMEAPIGSEVWLPATTT